MAKIKNLHYTICLNVFSSSGHVAFPPAFAQLEQRGDCVQHFLQIQSPLWPSSSGELKAAKTMARELNLPISLAFRKDKIQD